MKVLVVDRQALFAEALSGAFEAQRIGIVAVASSLIEVEHHLRTGASMPDVVVMDLGLPGALHLGRRIAKRWPATRLLALTATDDRSAAARALDAGFAGTLTKSMSVARLIRAIRSAAGSVAGVQPQRGRRAAAPSGRTPSADSAALLARQLTRRERQTLQLLTEGATSEEIAEAMNISRHTVRTHVQGILGKLGVHSRVEAAAFAVRHGLVDTYAHLSA